MFRAGSVEATVCPSRILEGASWATDFVEWWLWSVRWDGMTGMPLGAPRWPFPGGLLRQPSRILDAAKILRDEWPRVVERPAKPAAEGEGKA